MIEPEIYEEIEILDYKNPELPIKQRVRDLLNRMTLQEKVAQMLCIWNDRQKLILNDNWELDLHKIRENFKHGLGQIARPSDINGGRNAVELVELTNKIQRYFIEETRLGIPVFFHEECLHGMAANEATSYPQPIGLASTFNPDLVEKVYSNVAEDARSRGTHQALTPVLDVVREPRWGRVEETFGEDPYLISRMGVAAVNGFQGDRTYKDKKHVLATLKHFAAHGQPESGTNCAPVNVSERILRDIFLYPFKKVVTKCKPASVMPSYNEIDGIPSHVNHWLLHQVLREEWGFKGYLSSDYFAIKELSIRPEAVSHQVAEDYRHAAKNAVEAGINLELPDSECYIHLEELVNAGEVNESQIDELVSILLEYKFLMGLFEEPYIHLTQDTVNAKLISDRTIARQIARETIILLKNEQDLLPLNPPMGSTIAVIGPNADRVMLGGYSGRPVYYTTVLEGIKARAGNDYNVLYSEGCKLTIGGSWNEDKVVFQNPEDDIPLIEAAVAMAKTADIIILAIGGNEQTSREAWEINHLGDRADIDLFGSQNKLIDRIMELKKPTVAVLFNGRPLAISNLAKKVPAILECWYLGQESGNTVAEVLFGDYNPSGKLPISFPRSVGHIPCFYNYKPSARRGYLDADVSPLFPFGFGLSYASFKYSEPYLEKDTIQSNESTTVSVEVCNTGDRTGQEIVQLYIRDKFSSVTRPVKELKGFEKIELKPGETKTVILPITPESLAFTNIDMKFTVEPGDFEIMVGSSSQDVDLKKVLLHVI